MSEQDQTQKVEETQATILEATEAAKKKAEELDVDLATVTGTGKDGNITVSDIERAAKEQEAAVEQAREQAEQQQEEQHDELRQVVEREMASLNTRRRDAQRRGEAAYANGLAEGYYALEELRCVIGEA